MTRVMAFVFLWQGQGIIIKERSRLSQGKVKARSRDGQEKVKVMSRQGKKSILALQDVQKMVKIAFY